MLFTFNLLIAVLPIVRTPVHYFFPQAFAGWSQMDLELGNIYALSVS